MTEETLSKYRRLQEYMKNLGSAAIAFSGGVDSTFLLKVAHTVLGDRALAITAKSVALPQKEWQDAVAFCQKEGIRQLTYSYDVLSVEGFRSNPKDRCYWCKKNFLEAIRDIAAENGMEAVCEGSNLDDEGDYRPGMRAVRELSVKSPLKEVGLTKSEIRLLSKELGLCTWEKPSYACLASRFVYGEALTEEGLLRVERSEAFLHELGFPQVRVRVHNNLARIEVLPEDFERIIRPANREKIENELHKFGFDYVALDLGGYRTGSMNLFER